MKKIDKGELFALGYNELMQLGVGDKINRMHAPQKILFPANAKVTRFSCGQVFTLALCTDNYLYVFGGGTDPFPRRIAFLG